MKGRSFRLRLTLYWVISFGVLLAVAAAAIFWGSQVYAYRDLDANLRTLAATELASALDDYDGLHLHEFPVDRLGRASVSDMFVQILDADGTVSIQSDVRGNRRSIVAADVFARAFAGEAPTASIRLHGRPGRITVLRGDDGDRVYFVALGLFTDSLETTLHYLAWMLAIVWLASVCLTAALGSALAARVLRPVDEITRRASRIAEGEFAARLDPPRVDDEIGRMTRLLNTMLDRLHAAIEANRNFAADASHELRGPLTALRGEIDVVLQRDRSAAEYVETLRLLDQRVADLTDLTEDLLLLARVQEGRASAAVTEIPLAPFLHALVDRFASFASEREVRIEIAEVPRAVVYGDERFLERAVANVLRNAIQHNRSGGHVAIRGRVEEIFTRDHDERDGFVVIEVEDSGPGIPLADREHVFERFYRGDRSRSRRTGGHGLGLAICREVMKWMRGSIRIVRSSEAGTTFALRLPGESADP